MTIQRTLAVAAIISVPIWPVSIRAQSQESQNIDTKALLQRIEALDQEVRVLERKQELDKDAQADLAKTQPHLSLGSSGFTLSSADTNFVIGLHGLIQLDSRTFFNDGGIKGNDGFILRRVRPIISGTVYRDFDFLFVPDFGGSSPTIQDAFVNYRYNHALQLQAGKFKSPVGLEQLQSDAAMPFVERALPTDLVPNRDLGVELHGDLWEGTVSYAAGIFNGVPDSGSSANADFDDDKEFAGRLFFQPFITSSREPLRGLGFGVGGSYGSEYTASGVSSYKTDGQQKFFGYGSTVVANGTHYRVSPQGYYYYGPFGFLGEYVVSAQDVQKPGTPAVSATLQNTAWQVVGSWVLTGEDVRYNGVSPAHPFKPSENQWGALELSARYASLDIDPDAFPTFASSSTSARSASAWGVDLSWWLNRNIRVSTAFDRTTFKGGDSGTVTKQPENIFFTRIQLSF